MNVGGAKGSVKKSKRRSSSMFVDKTDKVVSIIPDRVLLTEGIKAQVAKEMAKELNPLHIDVKQIITLYRECGFSATTLNPYPGKMANFMEAFWSDKEDFLLSIKKEDKREEHVESKQATSHDRVRPCSTDVHPYSASKICFLHRNGGIL
jgi:hypothetical protein